MNKDKYEYMGIALDKVKHKELSDNIRQYAQDIDRPLAYAIRRLIEKGLDAERN